MACGQHVVIFHWVVGVVLVYAELKDMHQIVICGPSGETRSPGTLLTACLLFGTQAKTKRRRHGRTFVTLEELLRGLAWFHLHLFFSLSLIRGSRDGRKRNKVLDRVNHKLSRGIRF